MGESSEATRLAEVLGADSETVHVAGSEGIVVKPLRLKQLSEVLKCIDELSDAGVTILGDGKNFDTAKLFLRGGDAIMKLIAVATEQPLNVIQNLELDDAANLAGAVWRVNKNFFQKKVDTMLAAFGISPETAASLKKLLGSLTQSVTSLSAAPSLSPEPES